MTSETQAHKQWSLHDSSVENCSRDLCIILRVGSTLGHAAEAFRSIRIKTSQGTPLQGGLKVGKAAEAGKKRRQEDSQGIILSLREFRSTATCNPTRNQIHQTHLVLEPAWQGNFMFDWVEIKGNRRQKSVFLSLSFSSSLRLFKKVLSYLRKTNSLFLHRVSTVEKS